MANTIFGVVDLNADIEMWSKRMGVNYGSLRVLDSVASFEKSEDVKPKRRKDDGMLLIKR